jgi:biopolymer transport protein ExbD
MKIKQQTQGDDVQIQMIPLIDVIFCILTFFILATLQFSRQEVIKSINLDLPRANTGTPTSANAKPGSGQESDRLVLYIDGVGQVSDVSQPVPRLIPTDQLRGFLENYVKQNPTKTLVLNASRQAQYNSVIETLNLLREVGGDRAALGVADSSSPQQPNIAPGGFPSFPGAPGVPGAAPQPNIPPSGVNPNLAPGINQVPAPVPGQPQSGVAPAQPAAPPNQ